MPSRSSQLMKALQAAKNLHITTPKAPKRDGTVHRGPLRFNLMDLITELRLLIYEHAFQHEEVRDLCDLGSPALALVSKQVRAECLPVFFSECVFPGYLLSNDALAAEGELPPFSARRSVYRGKSGLKLARTAYDLSENMLMMDPDTSARLAILQDNEGITVVFRNIDVSFAVPHQVLIGSWRTPEAHMLRVSVARVSRPAVGLDCPLGQGSPAARALRDRV